MGTESDQAGNETARIEAFSDGVFAIAITLLVLDIKVPEGISESTRLVTALINQWPSYFAFLTSFFTIGIMWINHHRLFNVIGRSDHMLLVLNALLLLGVTFVPFPTSLLAEYALAPDGYVGAMVYSGTFIVISILFNLLWRYASHRGRLLSPRADRAEVVEITRQYAFGPLYYVVAFLLALVSVPASVGANMALAIYFALPRRPGVRRQRGLDDPKR